MAAEFIKVFTTSKTFAILTWINTKLRCTEDCGLLWIKQTDGPGLCFEDQYEALKISRKQLPASSETLIKAGCAKMSGRRVRSKTPVPTQNRSARGKKITEWLKMKVLWITLQWAGMKVQNGSKNLVIVHGRVRDDVEKKMWIKKNDK